MTSEPLRPSPGRVKAYTLYPEHVECFRRGLRTIETRYQPTRYRGPILLHAGIRDPASPAAARDPISRAAMTAIGPAAELTRGAIVLSAQLVDCVPINRYPARPMAANIYEVGGTLTLRRTADQVWPEDIQAQRHLGDFTPGRWGLLLEDIAPTTDRCPACWGDDQGWIRAPGTPRRCPVCPDDTPGRCGPIPARGRLGLWEWKWADYPVAGP